MFGLDSDTLRNIKASFSKFSEIEKVILYGSRAKGNYRNGSDIDITLVGKNLTLKNSIYPLMDELDEFDLPYTFDISIFDNIDNDDLIEHILRVGKILYKKEKELPKGWKVKKLGEVCEIKPPKKLAKKKLSENELVTFLPMVDLKEFNYFIKPIQTKQLKDVYKGYVYFENNDVLLAKITPCFENGKLGIASNLKNGIGFGSSEYMVFRPNVDVSSEYIYYFLSLENIRQEGKDRMTGAVGHKRIPVDYISNKKLLLPPLPEQKRIVAILDKAFTAIAKAKANAEQNLKNAKELFESYLQGVFENKGEDWVEEKLGNLGKLTSSKRIYKKEYVSDGIPFYRSKEIKELGNNKDITLELFITEERYLEIKSKFGVPQKGDILLTAVGTIGEMYVVKENEKFYFKDGNIMWLKDFSTLNTFYLKYALTFFVEKLKSISRGAAYSALTIEKLKKYSVPVPSLSEQKQIVQKLDALSAETKKLEAIYQQKIVDLEELKKSILQKAFNGELT